MIKRREEEVTLLKITETQLDFGSEEKEEVIAKIDMTIFEASARAYEYSSVTAVKYDYIGLTEDIRAESGMYIEDCDTKYKIKRITHPKKYNILYLERVI